MKRLILLTLTAIAMCGCNRTAKVSAAPPSKPPPPLPVVAEADIPAPAALTMKVEAGSNLRAIAEVTYGHERFSGFVASVNGIANPEQVKAGAILKTPSLPAAFREAGSDPRYQAAINALAKAWTDYLAELPPYLEARKASGVINGKIAIHGKSRDVFLKCADAIDAANRELETAKEPHHVPRLTIEQFAKASSELRALAAGIVGDYDTEMIGQRTGLGFTNAMVWARNQHR